MSFYLQEQVLSLGNDFYRFYQTKNRYDKAGMINLMKNTHPLYGKTTPGKKSRKWLPLVKRKTQLRLMPPNFNYGLQQQKKKALIKRMLFSHERKQVSTSRNEAFLEKCVFARCKSYFRYKLPYFQWK